MYRQTVCTIIVASLHFLILICFFHWVFFFLIIVNIRAANNCLKLHQHFFFRIASVLMYTMKGHIIAYVNLEFLHENVFDWQNFIDWHCRFLDKSRYVVLKRFEAKILWATKAKLIFPRCFVILCNNLLKVF